MRAAAVALLLVAAAKFPAFTAPLVDAAGVVPAPVEQQIDTTLQSYEQRSGNQIAVAVVKNTGKQSLEDYSIDLAREWGVRNNMPPANAADHGASAPKRAMVIGDQIQVRSMMYMALSYDHRIVDGKEAITFLVRIKQLLEDPARLMLEI